MKRMIFSQKPNLWLRWDCIPSNSRMANGSQKFTNPTVFEELGLYIVSKKFMSLKYLQIYLILAAVTNDTLKEAPPGLENFWTLFKTFQYSTQFAPFDLSGLFQ